MAQGDPDFTVRLYDHGQWTPDGLDPWVANAGQITLVRYAQAKNAVGDFEVHIPLTAQTQPLFSRIKNQWLVEVWRGSTWLFGGYVMYIGYRTEGEITNMILRGPSYLGWLAARKLVGGSGAEPYKCEDYISLPPLGTDVLHLMIEMLEAEGDDERGLFRAKEPDTTVNPRSNRHLWKPDQVSPFYKFIAKDGVGVPWLESGEQVISIRVPAFQNGIEAFKFLSEKFTPKESYLGHAIYDGIPALAYDIIRDPADNRLWFYFFAPRQGTNRGIGTSNPVIFDMETGAVTNVEYIKDGTNVRNAVWVLGEGEGATRARYYYEDTQSIIDNGRIEDVIDAGQDTDTNVIKQKADDFLAEHAHVLESVKFRLQETPNIRFGIDFFYGDRITAYWPKIPMRYSGDINSLTFTLAATSDATAGLVPTLELTVGSEKLRTGEAARILGRTLGTIGRRLNRLIS